MDIIDDISATVCDKCEEVTHSFKDIRKGYIYRAESQKTPLFSNTDKYKVQKEPYVFNICKKCSQRYLIRNLMLTFGSGFIGVMLMLYPFFDWLFYAGGVLIFIFLIILPETAYRSKTRLDEMSVRLFKKKYPEDFALKTTVPLTRKAYSEMHPDVSINIQETINRINKTNEEMIKTLEKLKQKNEPTN